jgi:hypothetical protein
MLDRFGWLALQKLYYAITSPRRILPRTLKIDDALREVDFRLDGTEISGLEQNPNTKSRWAAMAREGKKVMQFVVDGRYVAVVADGELTLYGVRK